MNAAPEIIYEDRNFLVIGKPAGLMVHAARRGGEAATLAGWLLRKYPELAAVGDDPALRPGIVHRLDKDTSGVMLAARNQGYFEYLKSLFQKHEIRKTYLAIVRGVPAKQSGTINAPIGIRNGTIKRSIHSTRMAKEAVTAYRVRKIFIKGNATERYSLLEVNPRTGRTHQIRVHLASIGHPVVGDRLYGAKVQPPWAGRLMLHALSLEFASPDGKRMKFEAGPPDDFASAEMGS